VQTHRIVKVAAITTATLLVVTFIITRSSIGDLHGRIEHEHGLSLPVSAASFECRGDAALGFLDRGVSSAFIMASNDLAGFVSQLRVQPGLTTFIPGNSKYRLRAVWRIGKPAATYSCSSPAGDWLHVEVWPIDDARVGICLYTDWN
jgi:hypothetical protein